MSRGLDPTMAAALANGVIQPAFFAQITLISGTEYVWSGIGDFSWNGQTWKGLGSLAGIGEIGEASMVQAQGTSVTLNGAGMSDLLIPVLGVTPPTPPRATVAGENVAWSLAKTWSADQSFTIPPNIWNGGLGLTGSAATDQTTTTLEMTGGSSIGLNGVTASWSDFPLPLEVPSGARITGVYPVVVLDSYDPFGFGDITYNASSLGNTPGTLYGDDIGRLRGLGIGAKGENSLPGTTPCSMVISFVGVAVYYMGSPLTVKSLFYEALNDIRIGAPAKIWFGLMSSGALLGSPYLLFSGAVDKPSVKQSPTAPSIAIALENRLVNLQRPSSRKYTAADQRLYYPTDIGFNWVEILQEISLKEGS